MIEARSLSQVFGVGEHAHQVLTDINLFAERASITAIVCPSGAGKSTLARCINLLQQPTSGEILLDGVVASGLSDRATSKQRRAIGTIFQGSSLLRRRTALQNVMLPMQMAGLPASVQRERAAALLERVHLTARMNAYPAQLSGGQQQRVGIARALALEPKILLADEATTGLHPTTRSSILDLLRELRAEMGLTIVLITHEMDVVREIADHVVMMAQGQIIERGGTGDLLLDPESSLGRELFVPRQVAAGSGIRTYTVRYASTEVPTDWMSQLSERVGATIAFQGASVEEVDGRTVGYVVIGIDLGLEALSDALEPLGLRAEPRDTPPNDERSAA